MWIQWPFFAKTWTKGHWPLDDLWPHICWGLMWDSTQGSLCPSPPWKYIKVCGYSDLFCKKNLNQRSLTPRWPLTPHLLRSYVWPLPKDHLVQVPWKYIKVCGYSELFAKSWTKGHWPLDDLWPHICWGHMCDCAQGSLCPSAMGIRQCMWIQLSILQKLPHTYIYILRTYYVHTTYCTTYRISDHIVSIWTTFRRDKNNHEIKVWIKNQICVLLPKSMSSMISSTIWNNQMCGKRKKQQQQQHICDIHLTREGGGSKGEKSSDLPVSSYWNVVINL